MDKRVRRWVGAGLAAGLVLGLGQPVQAGDEVAMVSPATQGAHADARDVARRVCVACHGVGGHAVSPMFPHLAGQPAAYLAGELRAFRSHQRDDRAARDFMWGIAGTLDDATIDALADYYAHQDPVVPVAGAGGDVAAGQALFEQGDAAHGIPACGACHGEQGQGHDTFPRIAGQQGRYLERQMREIRAGTRPAPVMEKVAAHLSDADIDAVAAYLASR